MSLFFDGFEQFDRAETPGSEMRLADYTVTGLIALGTGRIGTSRALILSNASVARSWQWTGENFSMGVAIKFAARGQMFSLGGGLSLRMDPETGRARIGEDSGMAAPVKDRWYYFEVVLNRTAETADVYINGKLDLTVPLSAETLASPVITATLNPSGDHYSRTVDDFYLNDGPRVQPIQVTTRFPTADVGPNEWAPTAGPSAAHYAMVAPLPVDKLDRYLIGNVSGAEESFASIQPLPDDNPVIGIGMISLVRKTTIDNLSMTTKFSGREVLQSDISLDWRYRFSLFALDGDNKQSIESATFGVVLNRS